MSVLICNVIVADADGIGDEASDVLVDHGRIVRIAAAGTLDDAIASTGAPHRIDGGGRLLLPGFIDAHSHADGALFDPEVQLALLRQGVTTVIGGQDGVSYAPGDGDYATEYFAAINGRHPGYRGGGVASLLAAYDGATALNAGYLVPAGTVRFVVCGRSTDAAMPAELAAMRALVVEGLAAGALGISTGLDYVPGIFASTHELAELAGSVADAGGVYVSHMRGGYEANSGEGIAEIAAIALASGARVHVSHFHAEPQLVHDLLASLAAEGVDASFDAYPYARGCSMLAMPLLPSDLTVRPTAEVVAELADPAARARLRAEWFPGIAGYASLGPDWPSMLTFAHIAAPGYDWAHGLTIAEGAAAASAHAAANGGTDGAAGDRIDAIDFALDVLVASNLEVNVVMAVQHERSDAGLAEILAHPTAIGGSDGIFLGRHPHPRARGSFSRLLSLLVREQSVMGWADASALVSARAAARFGLGERGLVREGFIADLVLVDPETVRATATYDAPLGLGLGIDDVLVAGVPVLAGGELTGATPGRGIRRGSRVDASGPLVSHGTADIDDPVRHEWSQAAEPEEA